MMEIENLITLVCVVEEGNFSRAAWRLDITQPAVSARIQALEKEVDSRLFVRGRRRLQLTTVGKSFLPYARRTLQVLKEGIEVARQAQLGEHGRITMGVIESLTEGFLASAVTRFQQQYPGVEFFIRTGHSKRVAEMLRDRMVSLGILIHPHRWLDLKPLLRFSEPIILATSKHNPLAAKQPLTLADLAQVQQPVWIVKWDQSPLPERVALQVEATSDLPIGMVRRFLLRGQGVALLTRTLIEDNLANGSLVALELADFPALYRDTFLVKLDNSRALTAVEHNFMQVLKKEAGALCSEYH